MPKVLIESQYFPTIAFFSLMRASDLLVIDQHENYHKGSFRNRAYILSSQGPLSLSVPLKSGKNSQTRITEVLIDNSDNWQVNHRRSLDACYGKSPYYEYYIHLFKPLFEKEYQYLFVLNLDIIHICKKILEIETEIELSEKFVDVSQDHIDLKRDFVSPKKKYAQRLNDFFNFRVYDQVFSDEHQFEPNLSILDLIFCLGPEAGWYLASTIKKQ